MRSTGSVAWDRAVDGSRHAAAAASTIAIVGSAVERRDLEGPRPFDDELLQRVRTPTAIIGPVVGHASWHAYRDAVGVPPAPSRTTDW